jgi:hypothetical protein
LPAGFSAEHLGPNDYYYWDDYWAVAGLRAAAKLAERYRDPAGGKEWLREADALALAIERSLGRVGVRLGRPAIPASPYRRLDAGAIGSLAAGYPLALYAPDDPRLLDTAEYLLANCFVDGAFFQDMVHSGLNPYLTLHVAQVLLRRGDARCFDLIEKVAALASPTGQWPEAIHPRTGGGCMGDGQHAWAAAEWVLMIRNCFIREEGTALVLGSGIPAGWSGHPAMLSFGPAPTEHGPVSLRFEISRDRLVARWVAAWRGPAPCIEIRVPGFERAAAGPDRTEMVLAREGRT